MVGKKTKIGKMFHNDKEYAEHLIKEAMKKKDKDKQMLALYQRIAHKFFIHSWKRVKRASFLSVNKCRFCGEFQCVNEAEGRGGIYTLVSIVGGSVLLTFGVSINPTILSPGIIVAGIMCIWNFIKRTCEYSWKDNNIA